MLETPAARKVLRARQTSLNGTVVASRQGLRAVLAQQLYSSVDGRGLAPAPQVPAQHRWVTAGDMTLSGHAYVGAIKIRGNLVATALRSARGRPHTDIRCDCCGRPEALSHILQSCPRAHASRIARHDNIVDLVISNAERIGYSICREPAIPTPAGIRKPDLILVRDYDLTILDVTIVADNADLEQSHQDKQVYYDVPAIREWVQQRYEPRHVALGGSGYELEGASGLKIGCRATTARTERAFSQPGFGRGCGTRDLDCQSFQALDLHHQV